MDFDELEEIAKHASEREQVIFRALDKMAMIDTSGRSAHCARCDSKINTKSGNKCAKCGAPTKSKADYGTGRLMPQDDPEHNSNASSGSGEESDSQEHESSGSKTASVEKTALNKFWTSAAGVKGLAVLGGTGYGVHAIKKALPKDDKEQAGKHRVRRRVQYKTAAVRKGNPIFNMRLARRKKARGLAKLFSR